MTPDEIEGPKTTAECLDEIARELNSAANRLRTIQQSPDSSRSLSLTITNLDTTLLWLGDATRVQTAKDATA